MLQREVTPTGESSSIIHVVYLLSICLVELLLQVFVQPHTLVLQILRKLLVQKNRSAANVHRWLLCCVRYYRDELWMDVSMGPAGIRTLLASKAAVTKVFRAAKPNAFFGAISTAVCHSIFFTEESVALAVPTTLGCFWSVWAPTYSLACFLCASSQNYIQPLLLFSPWYLGTCGLKMSYLLKFSISQWTYFMYFSPCTSFMYCSLWNVKTKLFKALNNHHLDKQISVKNWESSCTVHCSGTFSKFQWFGTKSGIFRNWEGG